MPRFPRSETEIIELADQLLEGLARYREMFPNGDPDGLGRLRRAYQAAKDTQMEAFEAYKAATEPKDASLRDLIDKMKLEIKQAEVDTENDPARLRHVGWGWTTPSEELQRPGRPRELRVERVPEGVRLSWQSPARGAGGRVQFYEIYYRPAGKGEWRLKGTSLNLEEVIDAGDRSPTEFHVVARNKKGSSDPSEAATIS